MESAYCETECGEFLSAVPKFEGHTSFCFSHSLEVHSLNLWLIAQHCSTS